MGNATVISVNADPTSEWVDAARTGDPAASAALVSLYGAQLLSYSRLLMPWASEAAVEEVTERAVEKALVRIRSYQPDRASLPSWFRGFIRFEVRDFNKREPDRHRVTDLNLESVVTPTSKDSEIPQEIAEILTRLLDQASETDQLLISLRTIEHLPYSAIAEMIGVSEATCRQRHLRALRRLREKAQMEKSLLSYVERKSSNG
jgi:RNA polymerase sigma factor (sigma-70 family)